MIEYRDLYDKDRNLTGDAIKKGDPIPEGLYIIVVLVFIEMSRTFLVENQRNIDSQQDFLSLLLLLHKQT